MQVACVHCGKGFSLSNANAGSYFRCRNCQKLSPVAPPADAAADGVRARVAPKTAQAPTPRSGDRESSDELMAVACGACGEPYRLRSSAAGKQFKCRRCGASTIAGSPPTGRRASVSAPPAGRGAAPPAAPPSPSAAADHAPFGDSLFAESLPPTSSYTLSSAPVVTPKPTRPAPPRRKKRKARADDDDSMSRLFGGLICVAIGIGIAAFAFYTAQNMERPTRWVGRIGWAGVCTVVLGFRIAFGWYKRD